MTGQPPVASPETPARAPAGAGAPPGAWQRHARRGWILVAVLLGAGLLGGSGLRLLRAAHLLPERQAYTELFFTDPTGLPSSYRAGAPLAFRFEIVDDERRPTAYRWQATIAGAGTGVLGGGTIHLDPGRSAIIAVQGLPGPVSGPAMVRVHLAGRRESLHFPVAGS